MNSDNESEIEIRNRLVQHLKGGHAYTPIDKLIEKVPYDQLGIVPDGLPYSFYQLFYHIRYGQHDILQYCINDDYQTPAWPDDYWPGQAAPASENEWQILVSKYFNEREALCDLVQDVDNDLLKPFTQNPNHNLFREILLVKEHSAYHIGQLFVIYRLLKNNG